MTVEDKPLVGTNEAQWSDKRFAHRGYTRQNAEPLVQRSEKLFTLSVCVAHLFHVDRNIEDVVRIETQRNVFGFLCAANEESRNDEKEQRSSDLRHHQTIAHPLSATTVCRAAAAFAQHGVHVGSRDAERRQNANNCASEQHHAQREQKNAQIRIEIEPNRQIRAEIERSEESGSPPAEQHSGAAAEKCEHQAFGQILANQSNAARADRSADRHFALTNGRANQKNIRNVEARNEEDQGSERGKCQSCIWNGVVRIGFRPGKLFGKNLDGDAFVGIQMLLRDAICDDAESCIRLCEVDARIQPGQERNAAAVAFLPELLHGVLPLEAHAPDGRPDRHESIHVQERVGAEEAFRRNTDDGHRAIIDL